MGGRALRLTGFAPFECAPFDCAHSGKDSHPRSDALGRAKRVLDRAETAEWRVWVGMNLTPAWGRQAKPAALTAKAAAPDAAFAVGLYSTGPWTWLERSWKVVLATRKLAVFL